MISVSEAVEFIKQHIPPLNSVKRGIVDACGFVAAEDINSPLALPPFDQSAMDGYANRFKDLENTNIFTLGGEVAAGGNYIKKNQSSQENCFLLM